MRLVLEVLVGVVEPEDIEILCCAVVITPFQGFTASGWYWAVIREAENITVQQKDVMFCECGWLCRERMVAHRT